MFHLWLENSCQTCTGNTGTGPFLPLSSLPKPFAGAIYAPENIRVKVIVFFCIFLPGTFIHCLNIFKRQYSIVVKSMDSEPDGLGLNYLSAT